MLSAYHATYCFAQRNTRLLLFFSDIVPPTATQHSAFAACSSCLAVSPRGLAGLPAAARCSHALAGEARLSVPSLTSGLSGKKQRFPYVQPFSDFHPRKDCLGGKAIREKVISSFILHRASRNIWILKNKKMAKTEGASVVGGRNEREKGQCLSSISLLV